MSKPISFRLNQATFDFGTSGVIQVPLAAEVKQATNKTHITLLMGANGTSKSRMLASCVNLFRRSEDLPVSREQARVQRMFLSDAAKADLECITAHVTRDGHAGSVGEGPLFDAGMLPSRLLAIANLVRDRFAWVYSESNESFYYYLGVRQGSNMTSTGALDSLMSEAFLEILADEEKYATFIQWVEKLFPNCELILHFSRYSHVYNNIFVTDPKKWLKQRMGSGRKVSESDEKRKRIEANLDDFKSLFAFINQYGEILEDPVKPGRKLSGSISIQLNNLPSSARKKLGKSKHLINFADSLGLIGRPSIMLKQERWLDFKQLSSGEQNLLATGARLLGYATPASLILIDEPEVSLNVAWQQRYIELISEALKHAPGSHVIIASHSPYLVSDLKADNATVVVVERRDGKLHFKSHVSQFWGWGSEAILYRVLGLPSASNYLFSQDLANVLKLIQEGSHDVDSIASFLVKCDQLDFGDNAEPLKLVVDEVRQYHKEISK